MNAPSTREKKLRGKTKWETRVAKRHGRVANHSVTQGQMKPFDTHAKRWNTNRVLRARASSRKHYRDPRWNEVPEANQLSAKWFTAVAASINLPPDATRHPRRVSRDFQPPPAPQPFLFPPSPTCLKTNCGIRMRDEGDSDRRWARFISGNRSLARRALFFRAASVALLWVRKKGKRAAILLISKKEIRTFYPSNV